MTERGVFVLGEKAILLLGAHVVMVAGFAWLLDHYEPDGFRLDSPSAFGRFGLYTVVPVLVGFVTRHRWATLLSAAIHATSPLWLVPGLSNGGDVVLVLIVWWVYVPALIAMILATDAVLSWWWRRG